MTRDDITRMAREAGLSIAYNEFDEDGWQELERFAALVRADEREACAKVCDERERANLYGVKECANAIRARGQE